MKIGMKVGLVVKTKILTLLEAPKVILAEEEVVPAVVKVENPNSDKIQYPDPQGTIINNYV